MSDQRISERIADTTLAAQHKPLVTNSGDAYEAALEADVERLEAQVAALIKERNYWKSCMEDPGVYWCDNNPPYQLWPEDDDEESNT